MRARRVAALFFLFAWMLSNNAVASPTLQKSSSGKEVLLLQKKLQSIGYDITELDGVFGDETYHAVLEFQHDKNIRETGVVNHATWRALKGTKSDPDKLRAIMEMEMDSVTITDPNSEEVPNYETAIEHQLVYVSYGEAFLPEDEVYDVIDTAKNCIGVPYVFGGTNTDGFDCSGFLKYVFAENGFDIPRLADEQYRLGEGLAVNQLVPGDLIFFTTYEEGASHCGLYLGDGKFIHAASSKGVSISKLDGYWKDLYIGGRGIVKVP